MIAFDVSHVNDARRTGIGRAVQLFIESILWLHEREAWELGNVTLLSAWDFRIPAQQQRQLREAGLTLKVLPTRSMYIFRATRLSCWAHRHKPDLLFVPEPIHPGWKGAVPLTVMHYDLITRSTAGVASRHIQFLYRWFLLPTLRAARHVGVDSEYVRRETAKLLPGFESKSEVLPIYIHAQHDGEASPPPNTDAGQPFVLFAGNLLPHKNVRRLVAAFERWKESAPGDFIPLYIVGRPRPEVDDAAPLLARLAEQGVVRHFGYVEDAHLEWLYRHARFFAFPSLVEGFGLPILEAMSRGCPVLTAAGGATEEAAGGAALLVDPTSVEAIHTAAASLAGDDAMRSRLRTAGTAHAQAYTRERHAHAFHNFLRRSLT